MIRNDVVLAIIRERGRQEGLVASGRLPWNCADAVMDLLEPWLSDWRRRKT